MNKQWVKSILMMSLFLTSASALGADIRDPANTDNYRAGERSVLSDFEIKTGIETGEYRLIKGDESCQEGELHLKEVDGGLTLMLGASPLVTGIGKGLTKIPKDRRCEEGEVKAEYGSGFVKGHLERKCGDDPLTRWSVKVYFQTDQIRYQRIITQGKKEVKKEGCILEKIE